MVIDASMHSTLYCETHVRAALAASGLLGIKGALGAAAAALPGAAHATPPGLVGVYSRLYRLVPPVRTATMPTMPPSISD